MKENGLAIGQIFHQLQSYINITAIMCLQSTTFRNWVAFSGFILMFFYLSKHNKIILHNLLTKLSLVLGEKGVKTIKLMVPIKCCITVLICQFYFQLLTLRGSVLEDAIPNLKPSNSKSLNTKEVLEYVAPEVQLSWWVIFLFYTIADF